MNTLDIRSEWCEANRMNNKESGDDDNEFMTPREDFGSTGRKVVETYEIKAH